ncbi:hypothetical protein O9G_002054 [Rozella allomycis CSF55]|uniref:PH domain-containing protein n=1 Tax=Rozella allomycis (strain CSF55) TaxID=988480 RepID=A0A075B0X5_ROZAC|nr:hypothetical protein O9G_002054 [Rozella allomycis CSF55]|eukprot:EPZ34481.1 hypothetical protein O9G_002054 [Rozella allomycis CSF55]
MGTIRGKSSNIGYALSNNHQILGSVNLEIKSKITSDFALGTFLLRKNSHDKDGIAQMNMYVATFYEEDEKEAQIVPDTVEQEGFITLYKEDMIIPLWKRYWFVLHGRNLSLYHSETGNETIIDLTGLTGCCLTDPSDLMVKNAIKLSISSAKETKIMYLFMDTVEETNTIIKRMNVWKFHFTPLPSFGSFILY